MDPFADTSLTSPHDHPDTAAGAVEDSLRRFRKRARWMFLAFAGITLVIAAIVLPNAPPGTSNQTLLLVLGSVLLGLGVDLALVVGLSAGRPWADHATVWVCWILLFTGIARTLWRLTGAAIDIPIDAILAVAVLSARPSILPAVDPVDRWRVWLLVAVSLVSALASIPPR